MKKKQNLYTAYPYINDIANANKKTFSMHSIIGWTSFGLVFALLGGYSGYYIYNAIKPMDVIPFVAGSVTIPSDKEVNDALKSGKLVETFKDRGYELINYALDKYASAEYSLTLTRGSTLSTGVTQTIQSAKVVMPGMIYYENTSSSSMVSTAHRMYDRGDGKVEAYLAKQTSDWPKTAARDIPYNEYIQLFGKLLQGKYYCTSSEDYNLTVTDLFMTLDENEFKKSDDSTKHMVNGSTIYYIEKATTSSSVITKTESGYTIEVDLLPSMGSNNYFVAQMKTTGNVAVSFTNSQATFRFDENLNIISSTGFDKYDLKLGGLGLKATQTLDLYYLTSSSLNFNDVELNIPKPNELNFNGYQLFPAE